MKILHIMLSNFYIDNFGYQENILTSQNQKDGHNVRIIASTETYIRPNELGYVKPAQYYNKDGVFVTRIPYRKILPKRIMSKFRSYPNVYKLIDKFKPSVIMFHGMAAFELLTIIRYKKNNPEVKIYLDSHSDFNNSAKTFISREILHKRFYAPIARKAVPYVDKIFGISIECIDFLEHLYKIQREKIDLLPLGGIVQEKEELQIRRNRKRMELDCMADDIVMVHTGKMLKRKRTEELLKAFVQVKNEKMKIFLIGELTSDVEPLVGPIIKSDERVKHMGWINQEELLDFLCASDVYLQPGSQSATLQNAICCGCAIMIFPHKSHEPYMKNNGFYVETEKDMVNVFNEISNNPAILNKMKKASYRLGEELLDYKKLAARIYE